MELDGKTTLLTYNNLGQPLTTLYADGSSVSRTYWNNGLLKQTTDSRGQKTD